jgi:regulator of PEP synthase PpsR (kinase-PPPase family)
VIKLANVALVEEDRTSDPVYRYAAARVVGLLTDPPHAFGGALTLA